MALNRVYLSGSQLLICPQEHDSRTRYQQIGNEWGLLPAGFYNG